MTLAEVQDGKLSRDQKWWRYLFLKSRLTEFCIVFSASICIAFKLIGPQILGANWSIIDNWDYFNWLGPDLNLPLSEVWHTLMTKTEVGSGVGRYRPSYYTLMVLETSLWGPNIHLWYLARTLEFGLFIASIWWIVSRFVGMWLSAVLLLPILAQPFWGDVWARLGPQEIYGCASVGLILFGAYGLFAGQSRGLRITGACVIALAGVILIGTKETFLPIAGLSIGLLFAAGSLRTIPRTLALCLIAIISAAGLAEFYIVQKIVLAAGADYNGNSIDLPLLISVGSEAFVHAIRIWGSVYLTVGLGCMFVLQRHGKDLRQWKLASLAAGLVFAFLVCLFVTQCVAYRTVAPTDMRYDFPRMLFDPLNYCLLACYVVHLIGAYFSTRDANYLSLSAAAVLVLVFAPTLNFVRLPSAVAKNIRATTAFYNELELITAAAKRSPATPIILEAHEPLAWASEPLLSLPTYLTTFGVENPISVRVHPESSSTSPDAVRVRDGLMNIQNLGYDRLVPLPSKLSTGCISVGINGIPASECTGFKIATE